VLSLLLDVLYPSYCLSCGSFLFSNHKIIACNSCWQEHFKEFKGKRCLLCGSPEGDEICASCVKKEKSFSFDRLYYYALYDGLVEVAIKELKFRKIKPLAHLIGREVASHLRGVALETGAELVIPVPLAADRLKERGFNQCEEILKGAGVFFSPIVKKVYPVKRQASLRLNQRRENIRGVFELLDKKLVKGKRVLIFDDVFTTGATASELAAVLKDAGADAVFVYTVAYTPKDRGHRQPDGSQLEAAAPY